MSNFSNNRTQVLDPPSSRQKKMERIDLLVLSKSEGTSENEREGNQIDTRQRKAVQDGSSGER